MTVGGSRLAKWALGILTIIVVSQSIFLLSLMRALHSAHDAADKDDVVTALQQKTSSEGLSSPVATTTSPSEVSWREIRDILERPLPPHYVWHSAKDEPSTTSDPLKWNGLPHDSNAHRDTVTEKETRSPPRSTVAPSPNIVHVTPKTHSGGTIQPKTLTQVVTRGNVHRGIALTGSSDQLSDVRTPKHIVNLKNAAVLILCFNRPDLLEKTIASVQAARLFNQMERYISQDGDDPATKRVAQTLGTDHGFKYMSHKRTLPPTLTTLDEEGKPKETPGTMYLADHYKWALDELFLVRGHSHVIILEDDMLVSKDFFEMFEALAPILDVDPTVWCISSWNDNGFKSFELPEKGFFRSSYFPGLGWMLKKSLWIELSPKFPNDNWDHWMRATTTSLHRECVSSWLSRNYNIGVGGATSNTDFYAMYLEPIQLHRGHAVTYGDLRYLLNEAYYQALEQRIAGIPTKNYMPAPMVTALSPAQFERGQLYLIGYTHEEFEVLGQALGIHPSPRSFYRRMQWLKFEGAELFLVDRRLSPFAPNDVAIRPHAHLVPTKAQAPGVNCIETCMSVSATHHCQTDQFDFINDCQVLSHYFDTCAVSGCTQGWGEDIPNTEVEGIGHRPMCLATEVVPTCEASFQFTQRLCPCVSEHRGGDVGATTATTEVFRSVVANSVGVDCHSVCSAFRGDGTSPLGASQWRCDAARMRLVSTCRMMEDAFPCQRCVESAHIDIKQPSFVTSKVNANFGTCFAPDLSHERDVSSSCSGSHPDMLRLCPCVTTVL